MTYNLNILCVDGTIYGMIGSNRAKLMEFLKRYDHEGATIDLVYHAVPGENDFVTYRDPEEIYRILRLP